MKDPIKELTKLLKEAGLVPFIHHLDCDMWNKDKRVCNMNCGPKRKED